MKNQLTAQELKDRLDCRVVARDLLGFEINKDRAAATWRDGERKSIHITNRTWNDFGNKDAAGSIIDLVMLYRGVDFKEALRIVNEYAADKGCISYQEESSAKEKPKYESFTYYVYSDKDRKPVHQTVRGEPKGFWQQHFDKDAKKWVNGLGNVELIPYQLSTVLKSQQVFINEGEKAADACCRLGLCGTTFAMGSGKWRDSYAKYFKNKDVVIIPDNDEAGEQHKDLLVEKLRDVAQSIKVVKVSDEPRGDCADFVEAGGTKEQLLELVEKAELISGLPQKVMVNPALVAAAEEANKYPFTNYIKDWLPQEDGGSKSVTRPRHINELVKDIHRRFVSFPCKISDALFDHDHDRGEIRYLSNPQELIAWIAEKSGHNVMWKRIEGAVNYDQLFSSLLANSRSYQLISGVPSFPPRDDVYYTHSSLPEPTDDAKYFNEFCEFFCPGSDADYLMMRAMFASLIYYRPKVDRPMWIIDTVKGAGQETGKTKLAEICAYLIGGDSGDSRQPFWVDPSSANDDTQMERVIRRLLSSTARQKRVFLLDNVENYFKSSLLASFITQGSFSGLAPYGHAEASRINDLFFASTCNGGTFNRDLISRSFFIHLKRPESPRDEWVLEVQKFIDKHKLQIIADIIGILKRGIVDSALKQQSPSSRFRIWERDVLMPILGNLTNYDLVWKNNENRKIKADGEAVEADIIRDHFCDQLSSMGYSPEADVIWLQSKVLIEWAQRAIPGYGGRTGRNVSHLLKNLYKTGMLPELADDAEKYPFHQLGNIRPSRGMMWNYHIFAERSRKELRTNIAILRLLAGGSVEVLR